MLSSSQPLTSVPLELSAFSRTGSWHYSFVLFARAIDANMLKILAIITGFMAVDFLSWIEFAIISDSKVAVDSLLGCSPLRTHILYLPHFVGIYQVGTRRRKCVMSPDRKFTLRIVSPTKRKRSFPTT